MPTTSQKMWLRGWDLPTDPKSDEAAQALVDRCLKRRPIMLEALKALTSLGSRREIQRQSRRYLMSVSVKIACYYLALRRKSPETFKGPKDGFWVELVKKAQAINPWKLPSKRSISIEIDKNGKERRVQISPAETYALELMFHDQCKVGNLLEPTQFITNGGLPAFEASLQKELRGAQLVLTTDIPACFENVSRDRVEADLSAPRQVTRNLLFKIKDNAISYTKGPMGYLKDLTLTAKMSSLHRGIPMGSAPSAIASEVAMSPMLKALNAIPGVWAASIGDNIIAVLKDKSAKGSVISAVTSSAAENFADHAVSELIRRIQTYHPSKGIIFCGRVYTRKSGKIVTNIHEGRRNKFFVNTVLRIGNAKALAKTNSAVAADAKFRSIEKSIICWAAQYPGKTEVISDAVKLMMLVPQPPACKKQ